MTPPVDDTGAREAPRRRKRSTMARPTVAPSVAFRLLREHWGHDHRGWRGLPGPDHGSHGG